jgi:hypothetical protein
MRWSRLPSGGEGAADAAELEAFEGYAPRGEGAAEAVLPETERGAGPGSEPF